jgi:hypothetical protein
MFTLCKDGQPIKTFETYNEALFYLHKIQGQSWYYAFKYGGYSITESEQEPEQ